MLKKIKKELRKYSNTDKIEEFKYFHKTNIDGYANNDSFLCINVPNVRKVAKKYLMDVNFKDIQSLFNSKYHEERLVACIFLVELFAKSKNDKKRMDEIVELYLKNYMNINGWDLVDLSAPKIIGEYIFLNPTKAQIIYDLANSDNMWKQRMAIVANWTLIKNKNYKHILTITDMLLNTKEDLIQKAIGWMLREVGKKDYEMEYFFVKKRYKKMPRTMLRYAIEKFDENTRQDFLKGRI